MTTVILGAGAIGGYIGAMLHHAGKPVALVDHWAEHVEAVRAHGLRIEGPDETQTEMPPIFHLGEMHKVARVGADLAILSVKLYDTHWGAAALNSYLDRGIPVVTLQNSLVEEDVARIVGWPRVLGGVATGMNVQTLGPGQIRRSSRRFSGRPVFKIGEMSCRETPRARAIADLLGLVDTTVVTTDLWNDRWEKLSNNAMVSPLGALADLSLDQVLQRPDTQRVVIALGAECYRVGRALGFMPHPVFGIPGELWTAAAEGGAEAMAAVGRALDVEAGKVVAGFISGSGQDLRRGRKSEVDFFNGYIAARAIECGTAAPTHAAVARIVHEIEAGRAEPGSGWIAELNAIDDRQTEGGA